MDISQNGLLGLLNENNYKNNLCVTQMDLIIKEHMNIDISNEICQITGIPYKSFQRVGEYLYQTAIKNQKDELKELNLNQYLIENYFL